MINKWQKLLCLAIGLYFYFIPIAYADVIKPALVEVTAKAGGAISIEIRASIEAMLTGINAQYKNTQDAPQAQAYDALRVMQPQQLQEAFEPFKPELLKQVWLKADEQLVALSIKQVDIPDPGYTKVPRASVIVLEGRVATDTQNVQWYYPATFGDNAVRVRQVNEEKEQWHWSDWQWLRKDEASKAFPLSEVFRQQPSVLSTTLSYIEIGFTHILPKGLDHILFIMGIFLFSARLKPLFWQVTMFTLAHSLTLGLSMNGIIRLPVNMVEPLIALSIAYIGMENIFARNLHNSRLLWVFAFGLLHGLGFAGVLTDLGMPDGAFAIALIGFNVGVELGQIAILLLGYFLLSKWYGQKAWYQERVIVPGSLLIATVGLYWFVERLAVF